MRVTNLLADLPLRERKRLAAMKRVQREAVERFGSRGFERVTVEEVAAAAEVSPMSVYRWFGTKEALVIWDEYDPPILDEVERRLMDQPPLAAVRDALMSILDEVYDRERELALDRARLIFREPALAAAAERNSLALQDAFAARFAAAGVADLAARALAAVAGALLRVAIEQWQHLDGERPLAELIRDSFGVVKSVS
jgi:AcrR family transcriptional regulator